MITHSASRDGTNSDECYLPVARRVRTALSISSGKDHTCAILDNGELQCWGRNDYGQLGDGTVSHSSVPVEASLSEFPVQLSSGDYHTCAILDDATIKCWGRNNYGQLGDGTNSDSRSSRGSVSSGGEVPSDINGS